jgi:hypothetical protein
MCVLVASAASSTPGAAELRPTVPGWQELVVAKETAGIAVQSRISSAAIALKFGGGNAEVLRTDPALFAVDKLRIVLDHFALVDVLRGKPADATLGAYRDFVNADLQKRGWREVATERATFAAGGQAPAISWAMQVEVGPAGKTSTLTLGLAAALAGSSIVAMSGVAEDAQGAAAIKRILTAALATLEVRTGAAMTRDVVDRLRQEAQRLVYRMSKSTGVILLNDELASQQDRQNKSNDIQKYVLSPPDMADAAAAAVAGSPNGPFMTFVNDGRSQHTFLIHAYDPATASFDYSDTTGSRSMLEAGNNLAGVEAVRKPGTTDRLWVVKKDQLQTVLSGMIIGDADLLAVGRKIHLGPLGSLGNTPADAKQTDFFKWFHLEETGKSPGADGGTTISYAPSAAKYRPLVTVRLQLAQAGWIRGAELVLKRRFIEDPREETSARDIAKSFLAIAAAKVDWSKIHRLHDEIFYLGSAKMMVHDSAAKDVTIPLIPSDGYQVFTGRRGHFVDVLSRSRLWMENIVADGEPALLVSIGAGG